MFQITKRRATVMGAGVFILAMGLVAADVVAAGPGRQGGMMGGGGHGMKGPMQGHPGGGAMMGQQQGMMNGMGQPGMQGQGAGQGMMDEAATRNMPEPVQMRMRVMMDMPLDEHDPACMLMLKDELNLTRDQILALNKVLADARQQAAALMTAPQRTKLREMAKTPNTGREMQKFLMQPAQGMQGQMRMQGQMQGGAGHGGMHGGR